MHRHVAKKGHPHGISSVCSGVTRVFLWALRPPGQLFLGEVLLGGFFCKIGGKYEIERKRKKRGMREIGEA